MDDVPEMVERVARAMCEERIREDMRLSPELYERPGDIGIGVGMGWHEFVGTARAAIAAMREPTEAVLSEMHDKVLIECRPAERSAYITNADDMWAAGIDAALSPSPPQT